MKRVFAFLFSLCLLLSLAACGEPAATTQGNGPATTTTGGESDPVPTTTVTPTTVPNAPKTVDLVTAYETEDGTLMGQHMADYRMDFVYADDYRSGTVTLSSKTEGATLQGTFTCDEHYNINAMQFHEDDTVASFVMIFDDQHRLLSAESSLTADGKTELRYKALHTYDDLGNCTYSQTYMADMYQLITENTYDSRGRLVYQKVANTFYSGETESTTTSASAYEYDENGAIKAIENHDADGQLLLRVEFTVEPEGENHRCTAELNGSKIVFVVNSQGKTVLTEMYNADGLYNRIENILDDHGRLVTQTQWSIYTESTTVTNYTYTADGRQVTHTCTVNGQESVMAHTTFQTVEIPE